MDAPETVFISYSHDSRAHVRQVLALSNRLRSEGIDCVLDQYESSPPEGWPRWMDRQVRNAHLVLMICTEKYYRRVMGEEHEGEGLGIKWEGNLIYQHLYDGESLNTKFVPVLFRPEDTTFIPTPLRGSTRYVVGTEEGYALLYARLLGVPPAARPPLGSRRALPKMEVKTDVAMFLSIPIDIDSWNAAVWSSVFYILEPTSIPILGLGYENEEPAKTIFRGWHERYGPHDEFEELRIAIIEGEIKGATPGYSIHIGADPANLSRRYRHHGFQVGRDLMLLVSRIHRMDTVGPALEAFKHHYRRHKAYLLIPGLVRPEERLMKPFPELGIRKGTIVFREAADITDSDIDRFVLDAARDAPDRPRE